MKKVLTVGGITQDVFLDYAEPEMLHLCLHEGKHSFLVLEAGKKVAIDSLTYFLGGGAANAAVSFVRAGFDVAIMGKIGKDREGEYALRMLREAGVDTHAVAVLQNEQTATSFIIPTQTGERIALVHRGANLKLELHDIDEHAIQSAQVLYGTSLCGPAAALLTPLVRMAKKHGLFVAINPGSKQLQEDVEQVRQALSCIDVLILNSREAQECMASFGRTDKNLFSRMFTFGDGHAVPEKPSLLQSCSLFGGAFFDVRCFFKEILACGPKVVVVTHGRDGVYVATKDNLLFHPSLDVKVISTLGAGDAFGSAFVSWLIADHSVEDALRAGIINSTAVIGHPGAQTGLCTQAEIAKKMKQLNHSLLQRFSL